MTNLSLNEKLERRMRVKGTTIMHFSWTGIVPAMRKEDIDFVIIEMEHNFFDWRDMEGLLRMCDMVGLPSIVRVPEIRYQQVSKVMDLGANGILIPRVETLEQLEQVIEFSRLPPVGKKGIGGYDFGSRYAKSVETYNTDKMIFVQMESPAGISNLEKMLQTKEVAGVIVGPNDLAASLGVPYQFDAPELTEAIKEVIRICDQYQTSCGMFMPGMEGTQFWCDQGMNIIWSGSDFGFLMDGFKAWVNKMNNLK